MKYVAAQAAGMVAYQIEADTFDEALSAVGLSPRHIDHGAVRRGVCIALYEFGLYVPPDRQQYFSIDRQLFAGSALLYGVDWRGATIDLKLDPTIFRWHSHAAEVEAAIFLGEIERPVVAVNGEIMWRWPDPRPDLGEMAARAAADLARKAAP